MTREMNMKVTLTDSHTEVNVTTPVRFKTKGEIDAFVEAMWMGLKDNLYERLLFSIDV